MQPTHAYIIIAVVVAVLICVPILVSVTVDSDVLHDYGQQHTEKVIIGFGWTRSANLASVATPNFDVIKQNGRYTKASIDPNSFSSGPNWSGMLTDTLRTRLASSTTIAKNLVILHCSMSFPQPYMHNGKLSRATPIELVEPR